RIGRARPFDIAGYSAAALARPVIALAQSWPAVMGLRISDRVGKGLRSAPRDALLSRCAAPGQLGIAFGVHRAFDNFGAVVGPLLAAAMLSSGLPVRHILAIAAAPGLLCVLLALRVREPPGPWRPQSAPMQWRWAGLQRPLRRLIQAVGLFSFGSVSSVFFLLRASEVGLAPAQVALLWAMVSAIASGLSVPLSGWSDRVGRVPLLAAGWTLMSALSIAFAAASAPWAAWALGAVLGVHLAATDGVERALVGDVTAPAQRGTAYGWYHLVRGGMLLPAAAWIGALWRLAGAGWALSCAGLCTLAAAALLWFWVRPAAAGPAP
ncbi:MAG TPA: MFS transporter, partial [Steroidobacteraceae bacterium]|nr:MFS transporter [Steroidobacteraceae bacterium]